jgi:hypothetical protein
MFDRVIALLYRCVPMLVPGLGGRGHTPAAGAAAGTARRVVALALAGHALVGAAPADAQSLDTVLTWNRAMLSALAVPGANPPTVFVTRPLAMVSVAVFDTANAFDDSYHPYATRVVPASGASRDAAVAQAAHDVLVALLPSQRAAFDTLLAASLAGLPEQAASDGAAVGAAVATATLQLRTGDGWERPVKAFVVSSLPGYWKPAPPANLNAAFTHYPDATGFIVPDGRRFLTEGPPPLTSERYARDFNETKALGGVDSAVRTAEQTQVARLWASVGTSTTFWGVWNQVVAHVARTRGLSGLEAARAFALVNMTHHDALLSSFTGKFLYALWRPVTAIREADTDGNGATDADPTWTPLVPTPPYPGHPGNMACLGAAQARVLERVIGQDAVPFQVTWTGTTGPDVSRSYNGFRQLADEGGQSRIWGGIHFTFETLASLGSCTLLGDYAADNVLRRR